VYTNFSYSQQILSKFVPDSHSIIKHVRVPATRVCAHLHLSALHDKLKIIQPSHCEFITITVDLLSWHV